MTKEQIPLTEADIAKWQRTDDGTKQLLPDLAYERLIIVNVVFYGPATARDREWVLIDTGLPGTASSIRHAARERFGENVRPAAIILTHGHVDHVGGVKVLAKEWDTPVFAHHMEHPYLNGTLAYMPSDPMVGGFMALSAPLMSRGPFQVGDHLRELPRDQSVPFMPGWKWIETPGHSPGHISLWRESDRTLIAGDAVITTRQESAYAVMVQTPELHGPPQQFTPDWAEAAISAGKLADLEPELIVSGHGLPMQGEGLRRALRKLADNFSEIAVPSRGLYGPNSAVAPGDARPVN